MHFTLATLAAISLYAAQVTAGSFWLTAGHIDGAGGPIGETGNHWVYTDDIECDTLNDAGMWRDSSDVSGDKKGVRVEWRDSDECGDDFLGHQCPSVVEMHNDDFHRTWYYQHKEMVDTDGNVVGHCDINMDHDFQCDVTLGTTRWQTLLHCTED